LYNVRKLGVDCNWCVEFRVVVIFFHSFLESLVADHLVAGSDNYNACALRLARLKCVVWTESAVLKCQLHATLYYE
jgi:hypothetical protein